MVYSLKTKNIINLFFFLKKSKKSELFRVIDEVEPHCSAAGSLGTTLWKGRQVIVLHMLRKIRSREPTCWMSSLVRCISSDISGKLIQSNLVQPARRTLWPLAASRLKYTPPLCNQALIHYSHICTAPNLCPTFPWMQGLDRNNLILNVPVSLARYNTPPL